MSPPVFAPLAAIVALCLSATTVRSLAPQSVLSRRAVSSGGAIDRAGEVTLAALAAVEAKRAGWFAAAGPVESWAATPASAPGKTRPPSGAYAGRCAPPLWAGADPRHVQRRAPGRARERRRPRG